MRRPIQHKLGDSWAQHFQETIDQINAFDRDAYMLEGQAAAKRREVEFMRKHLGVLIDQIATAEKLPPSLTPYKLSPDAKALLGEVEIPEAPEADRDKD